MATCLGERKLNSLKLCWKTDLVSHTPRADRLVNTYVYVLIKEQNKEDSMNFKEVFLVYEQENTNPD